MLLIAIQRKKMKLPCLSGEGSFYAGSGFPRRTYAAGTACTAFALHHLRLAGWLFLFDSILGLGFGFGG